MPRRVGVNSRLVRTLSLGLPLVATLAGCSSNPAGHADAAIGDGSEVGDGATADLGPPSGTGGGEGGAGPDGGFRALFNGTDFTGWDRYLGTPNEGGPPLGLDNDPRGVYSVVDVDGEPAIRLSGEVFGALTTKEEYCHFDLRAQYRWGSKLWPPLNFRDSGIMYMSTGPFGAVNAGGPTLSNPIGSGGFMVSIEYQVSTGGVGTIAGLGPVSYQMGATTLVPEQADWNDVEIIVDGAGARHLLNGQQVVTASGFGIQLPGQAGASLSCGKLQLESESAEVFYRRLEILPLP